MNAEFKFYKPIQVDDRVRDDEGVLRRVIGVGSDGWLTLEGGGAGISSSDVDRVWLPGERVVQVGDYYEKT